MPIVQAGRQFTAEDIQRDAGNLAAVLRDATTKAAAFRAQLETWPDPELVALGLSQEDVNAIKGFFVGDLPAVIAAVQNSVWIKQLLGTGV
jgi:hypothetical protein